MATYAQQTPFDPIQMSERPHPFRVPIAWAAVFAGLVAGLATHAVLMLLGAAVGMTVFAVGETGLQLQPATFGSMIWTAIAMLIAAFVAGFIGARTSGRRRKMDGMLHGCVIWGATTILYAVMSLTAMGAIFGGAFSALTQTAQPMQTQEAGATGFNRLMSALGANTDVDTRALTPSNFNELQSYIQAGDRLGAVSFLQSTVGMEQESARTVANTAFVLSGQPGAASPQAQQAVEETAQVAAWATWLLLIVIIASLALSVWGGILGSNARPLNSETRLHPAEIGSRGPHAQSVE